MFWVLLIALFMTDGSKQILAKPEPTEAACRADATKALELLQQGKPQDVAIAGGKCIGPLDDPTIPKTKA